MKNKRFNSAALRARSTRALAGLFSVAAAAALASVAGCGGGGGSPASSSAAQPAPAPAPSSGNASGTSSTSSCASAQAAASTASTTATAQSIPVDHLIVKLAPSASTSGSGASILAATNDATRVANVIDRVMSQWNAKTSQAHVFAAANAALAVQAERTMSGGATLLSLGARIPTSDATALAQAFAADPDVAYAEPDRRLFATTTSTGTSSAPTDPDYAQQWNYFDATAGIDLPAAWGTTTGASTVVTAVLDTGYRPHADITNNLLPGYDFISDIATGNDGHARSADATDPGDWVTQQELSDPSSPYYQCQSAPSASSWHGTLVAGLIGASANNGIGIAGVSWNGKILPVRVLGKCGGSTSDIADAMRWAAGISVTGVPDNPYPAKVINLSLGGAGACSTTFQQAIDDVLAKGVTVIVAAGNDGSSAGQDQPANCKGVIAVGATDNTAKRAWYSNFGADVTVSAPGSNILSTSNTGTTTPVSDTYATNSGTSLAAPQVSGVASLMLAVNPSLTPAQISQKLVSTVRASTLASTTTCTALPPGAGIVDAGAAVASASQ